MSVDISCFQIKHSKATCKICEKFYTKSGKRKKFIISNVISTSKSSLLIHLKTKKHIRAKAYCGKQSKKEMRNKTLKNGKRKL
jgi:hypothetical protein